MKSGSLEWTPVHRSERFWRENVTKLNDNKHELLRLLVAYLSKDGDNQARLAWLTGCSHGGGRWSGNAKGSGS